MKFSALIFMAFSALLSVSAQADVSWAGNTRFSVVRRGNYSSGSLEGQTLNINICDYGTYTLTFEAYKPGVTDVANSSVWQNINAQMRLVQDSTGVAISGGSPSVTGQSGNNAVYSISLRSIAPQAVTGLDPNSEHTHLFISLDGNQTLSIPIHFACVN